MRTATWKRPLVLSSVAALALMATTPSFGQATHHRQPTTQKHGGGETSGQALQSRSGDPSDQRSSNCWISSDDNDHGTYGYLGPCSDPRARPVK